MAKDKSRLKVITDRLDAIELSLKGPPEVPPIVAELIERLETRSDRSAPASEVSDLATRLIALEQKQTPRSAATTQLKDISGRVARLEQRLEEILGKSGEIEARLTEALNRSLERAVVSTDTDLDDGDTPETGRSEAARLESSPTTDASPTDDTFVPPPTALALEEADLASEPAPSEQPPATPDEPDGSDPLLVTDLLGSVSQVSPQWWNDDVTAGLAPTAAQSEDELSQFIAAPDPAARPPRVVTIDPNPLPPPGPTVRRFKKALRRGDQRT